MSCLYRDNLHFMQGPSMTESIMEAIHIRTPHTKIIQRITLRWSSRTALLLRYRLFPWGKATRNHSNNKEHALWHRPMSVLLSSITNTGQNDFITRSILWSSMVMCSTPSSADCFHMALCGDRSKKVATTAQVTVRDIDRLLRGESFILVYINTLFTHWKSCTAQTWLPKLLLK